MLRLSKPSQSGWVSDAVRDATFCDAAVTAIVPVLPASAAFNLLGGERSVEQAPHPDDRQLMLRLALRPKAGPMGEALWNAVRTLTFVEGYARAKGWSEAQTWPLSRMAASMLIAGEHARALAEGSGSRGGATVGASMRSSLIFLKDHLGLEIDFRGDLIVGSAPAAKVGEGRRSMAATMPLQVFAHLEYTASSPVVSVARFYARSFCLAAFTSIRIQDCVRAVFWRDEDDPRRVIRGRVSLTKDGAPMNVYAPAMGFTSDLTWLSEHLQEMRQCGGGHAFPDCSGP